ncbi:hypothetical protein V8F20_011058 [Naviculisporaceae sp. PSN 640]
MRWSNAFMAVAAWASTAAAVDDDLVVEESSLGIHIGGLPPSCSFWASANLTELGTKLSPGADIYLPGSSSFNSLSQRWSELQIPQVNVTVSPATENDVVETVKWANKYRVPFLVFNGVHGSITTLGQLDCGVNIAVEKLSGVTVASSGLTATILGGTQSKLVTDTLWAADKQTVTGTCECVSYLGPALGGGHGWLQGHYGLVADQFVSMNIVLGDGTLKTITPSSDLWWAVKGAGHNFGIVTSVAVKVYPANHKKWAIETLMFTGDKVQAVYQAANDYLLKNGTQPVDVINWSYWFNLPDFDGPVIAFYIIQEGVDAVDPIYTAPFHAIGPFSVDPVVGDYRDLARWVGIDLAAPPCQKAGLANPRFPVYLEKYNATAQQQIYNIFKAGTNTSSPFHNSLFMFEGYSLQGVKAVPSASTAFAWRGDNLLIAPLLQYTPAGPALDAAAKALGNQLRQVLYEGAGYTEPHAYVNYAYGDEGNTGWYGPQLWRQAKLKLLKAKYDPLGRFSYYGGITLP